MPRARTINGDAISLELWDGADARTGHEILAAGSEVDGRPNRGLAWLRWKMCDSPLGPAVTVLARDRSCGQLAGVVAFGRWGLWRHGGPVEGSLSYETFILPSYQRRGLFSRMVLRAMEELRGRGVEVILNFPNARSLPGFLKLGWQSLGGFETWIRPTGLRGAFAGASRWIAGARNTRVLESSLVEVDETWIERAGELAEHTRELSAPWATARDVSVLRWRYATRPTFRYITVAHDEVALLARLGEVRGLRECRVIEGLTAPDVSASAVRQALGALAQRAECDLFTVQITRAHPLRRVLRWLGFVPVPHQIHPCARRLAEGSPPFAPGEQWVMSSGDFHTT